MFGYVVLPQVESTNPFVKIPFLQSNDFVVHVKSYYAKTLSVKTS